MPQFTLTADGPTDWVHASGDQLAMIDGLPAGATLRVTIAVGSLNDVEAPTVEYLGHEFTSDDSAARLIALPRGGLSLRGTLSGSTGSAVSLYIGCG